MSSDLVLLRQWGEGDARSGDRLFRRHVPAILRFFRNKISGDLEDLVQETFLRGLAARERYRGESSFCGYLLGIACRVLADYYRLKYRTPEALDIDEITLHDVSPSPSLAVAERHEHQLLLDALRRIPLMYQVALELHYWEDMTSRAIAEALEIPHGTAQTRLARGRDLLAAQVEQVRASVGLPGGAPVDLEEWAVGLRGAIRKDG